MRDPQDMLSTPKAPRAVQAPRRGFTLLETALAIIIVGSGVLAILYAQMAFHRQNDWSTHTSTATFLANEIREMTVRLTPHDPITGSVYWGPEPNELTLADFDDLDDFDGVEGLGTVFSEAEGTGPVNAQRLIVPDMPGWSQVVRVGKVPKNNISGPEDPNLASGLYVLRVEVTVFYQGASDPEPSEVTKIAWINEE